MNQLVDDEYHWLDDTVFFRRPGRRRGRGPARPRHSGRSRCDGWSGSGAELDEQQRAAVAAARLEEQTRIQQQVHAGIAERIAGIAILAEGARALPGRRGPRGPGGRRPAASSAPTPGSALGSLAPNSIPPNPNRNREPEPSRHGDAPTATLSVDVASGERPRHRPGGSIPPSTRSRGDRVSARSILAALVAVVPSSC